MNIVTLTTRIIAAALALFALNAQAAATLTGTPVAVTWAAGANPAGQSITIPSDATAVCMFWSFYSGGTAGLGLSSATLAGANPAQTYEAPTGSSDQSGTGVACWYNPPTGSQTLDPAWDASPEEGATTIVAFIKGGDTSWRDADAAGGAGTSAVSVTLTTAVDDLVLKYDQRYGTGDASPAGLPSLSSGWINAQTQSNVNNEYSRLSYISATGATQVCDSEIEYYSTIAAISIPAAAVGGSTRVNPMTGRGGAAAHPITFQ